VVVGARDPNPIAANGSKILSDAGIKVEFFAPLSSACEEVAEVFFLNQRLRRSFVHAKVATSLDGQMALATGESQWITNEKSRHFTQQLRGETDAVLIGYNTFAKDNPRLNSRHPSFSNKVNRVVILDPDGKSFSTIPSSALTQVRGLNSVVVIVSDSTDVGSAPKGLEVVKIPLRHGQFPIDQLLKELFARGIFSVLVEGGAATLSEFLKQKLIDRITIMMAPTIIGAQSGLSWTKDFGVSNLEMQVRLLNPHMLQFDSDICITARIDSPDR
jgi:diaminohydroxyphosphoribosylaminopyrimidine deaminase/5-amino-6-(5-phosphoribosylamino)uracil reductase